MPAQHHLVAPPVIIAATPIQPLAAPQPAIAPSLPPVCTVDLMTLEGSAIFGAQWKTREAKIIEVPAIPDAMPEFTTTYDIDPHAGGSGFRRLGVARHPADRIGGEARWRQSVLPMVSHVVDDPDPDWYLRSSGCQGRAGAVH